MMAHFKDLCTEKERQWAGCPPEAIAKMRSQDEEKVKKEYAGFWVEADANKDGALNVEEWMVFMRLLHEFSEKNYGWAAPMDEVFLKKVHAAIVEFTPNENGVTQEAMLPFRLCAQAIRVELAKAAAAKA